MTTSPSHPIRIMVVDDHEMVRQGLTTFLKAFDDLQLVAEARDGTSAIQLCGEILPDVILMDMVLPDMDGASVTHNIRKKHPKTQIIALTSFKEGSRIKKALEAGAIGYLTKDVSADDLARAIHAAHAGRATLSSEATQALVEVENQLPVPGDDLTEREHEVLLLMIEGLNNIQIAGRLSVSPSTIKSHVSNILAKLGVSSRTEAVTLALRSGIAPPHGNLIFKPPPNGLDTHPPTDGCSWGIIFIKLTQYTQSDGMRLVDNFPGDPCCRRNA